MTRRSQNKCEVQKRMRQERQKYVVRKWYKINKQNARIDQNSYDYRFRYFCDVKEPWCQQPLLLHTSLPLLLTHLCIILLRKWCKMNYQYGSID